MMNVRVTAIATGLVQGVNFRVFVQQRARELGLIGYVCNRADGAVEIIAEGSREILERLVDAARRGPPSAHVESVDAQWSAATAEFHRFEIRE
ncbi:MAG: acylphosphatase [Chloroflexi bacterium]|nr:acylphosphatase [Chloroflexota bacterium]MBI3741460.1 acylphosphatase [Chloroflexota bacterium]